jgi:hypothetical protein
MLTYEFRNGHEIWLAFGSLLIDWLFQSLKYIYFFIEKMAVAL